MFKIFVLLLSFIKQLLFDCTDEYMFKSYKFNTRKFAIFVIIIISISLNVIYTKKFFYITEKIHEGKCHELLQE